MDDLDKAHYNILEGNCRLVVLDALAYRKLEGHTFQEGKEQENLDKKVVAYDVDCYSLPIYFLHIVTHWHFQELSALIYQIFILIHCFMNFSAFSCRYSILL